MLLRKSTFKKSKGFLSLDTAFSLVVIIGLAAYVQSKTEPLGSKNDEAVIVDAVTHIIEGSKNFKAGHTDGYATMTMTSLVNAELVPPSYDDTGVNPNGGDYTISNAAFNTYDLSITNLNEGLCNRAGQKLGRFISTNLTACATGTLTVNVGTPVS